MQKFSAPLILNLISIFSHMCLTLIQNIHVPNNSSMTRAHVYFGL